MSCSDMRVAAELMGQRLRVVLNGWSPSLDPLRLWIWSRRCHRGSGSCGRAGVCSPKRRGGLDLAATPPLPLPLLVLWSFFAWLTSAVTLMGSFL